MCCHSSGPEQTSDASTIWPHLFSRGILALGVKALRWELRRVDVWGATCGVETKCMLSLHTICSGMHFIKRAVRMRVSVCMCVCMCMTLYALCIYSVCPHNYFSQNTQRNIFSEFLFSKGIYVDFPDHLSYVNSAISAGTPCLWSRRGMGNQGAPFTF